MLKFNATAEEQETIRKIVDRAEKGLRGVINRTTLSMDIEIVHSNIPLQLTELLNADDFEFAHDVFGIRRHINRETGELEDCFMPRFAVQ